MHKRRRRLTEPEARYFLAQIAQATLYIHSRKIIHRGFKLSNLYLNDKMEVKVGGFGLATTVHHDGERKT